MRFCAVFVVSISLLLTSFTSHANNEWQRLSALMDQIWEWNMYRYPEFATSVSFPGQNDRWTDLSEPALAADDVQTRKFLEELNKIKRKELNSSQRIDYDLLHWDLQQRVQSQQFPSEYLQINQLGGLQQSAEYTLSISPQKTLKDYQDILSRMEKLPRHIEQTIQLLEKGLSQGITPPKITLRDVPDQIDGLLNEDVTESALYKAFKSMPKRLTNKQQKQIRKKAQKLLNKEVYPAYKKLKTFLENTYIPNARTTIGQSMLPNGEAWYEQQIRWNTSTQMTAEEIHSIGLREVKRIHSEMQDIVSQSKFKGDYDAYIKFINNDPQFFFESADALVSAYRDIGKRADAAIPALFKTLPRLTYGIKPIPAYSEKSAPAAYYYPGSITEGRPGFFMANTYNLAVRPKWEMVALALHEAVPGHHLQISIAQELPEVHQLRRYSFHTAYSEGWALYAESLGNEMGLYKDNYAKFGQLTYEMWRAIRLVVDTGMHALGWSRQQAIDYFKQYSPKPEHDIIVEIDRYIVWPGQALSYKIGELKIKALRQYAEDSLGEHFDIREFHDQILANGSVTLNILEQLIKDWVNYKKHNR